MKKGIKWILLLLALIVLISGARFLYESYSKDYAPETIVDTNSGTVSENNDDINSETSETETVFAPDFTVYDKDGNKVNLSDFKNKKVIVNFWASWCGPCKNEMPDFEEAFKKYGDDIVFMMVNMTDGTSETQNTAESFIESQGYTFPVYFDKDESAVYAYYVYSIPATYFINSDGTLAAYARGMINEEALEEGINMMK